MSASLVRTPLYVQLSEALVDLIQSEDFAIGQPFLSEREICERFEVSRPTANKAVSNLVVQGFLEQRRGVGTFVRAKRLDYDLARLISFTEKARAIGLVPSTRVLEFVTVAARETDEKVLEELAVGPDEHLYRIKRLRLVSEEPVILEHRHVVARLCPDMQREELEGSLYQLWRDKYQLQIGGADQVIRAVATTAEHAELLEIQPGSPCIVVHSVGHLVDGTPLWVERTLYRAELYEFRSHLTGVGQGSPATGELVKEFWE